MCAGNCQPNTLKQVISAQAEYATNKVSGPISKGGFESNSPRHSRMVRTCSESSSSTYATMHKHIGQAAVLDLIFEVADDDLPEALARVMIWVASCRVGAAAPGDWGR